LLFLKSTKPSGVANQLPSEEIAKSSGCCESGSRVFTAEGLFKSKRTGFLGSFSKPKLFFQLTNSLSWSNGSNFRSSGNVSLKKVMISTGGTFGFLKSASHKLPPE